MHRRAPWGGQIIDGRHRARACEVLGLDFPTRDMKCPESELPAIVWSLNGERRDLSPSQRAMIAAKLANLQHGTNQHESKVDTSVEVSKPVPIAKAAAIAHVSRPSVETRNPTSSTPRRSSARRRC